MQKKSVALTLWHRHLADDPSCVPIHFAEGVLHFQN